MGKFMQGEGLLLWLRSNDQFPGQSVVNPAIISFINSILAAPGQFLFINSEILENNFLGIDTAFATMSDQPTQNLGLLGQPIGPKPPVGPDIWPT